MDISIAVSLIRGQMGTVVEQAVNGAVETVLAEMLKVVGAKFEELKVQVAHMKRDITSLQREKALKEKENENIRAKLRYTELKLKYYRQGVEEELQQRASASALVRIHPSSFLPAQRGGSGSDIPPSSSAQTRTSEGPGMRTSQECTSPHNKRQRGVRGHCHPDVSSEPSELLPVASLSVETPTDSVDSSSGLFCPGEQGAAQIQEEDQEEDCEWTMVLEPQTAPMDPVSDPPHVQTLDSGQLPGPVCLSAEGSSPAVSSTLPPSSPQVKEEEEVICIKEEQEEEQVTAALLMDCQAQQSLPSETEAQTSMTEWPEHPDDQRNHTAAFSAAGTNTYVMPQAPPPLPLMASQQTSRPQQAEPPWPGDLSLYEEYKLRRNELRRMNLSRRRELEKMLPQPLLADLVRERREKTRLRVARWRAKRKLQAGLNQIQAEGGAAGFSSSGFPISSQRQQQLRGPCASSSSGGGGGGVSGAQSSPLPPSSSFLNSSISNILPFIPASSSSSSSSLHLSNSSMTLHQHAVTSSSSPSYPQLGLSQHAPPLADSDIIQCRV